MNKIKCTITHIHPHTVYIYIMHTCTTMFSCTTMYTSIPKFPLSQTFEHCPFFGPLSQAWLDFQSPLDAPWVHRMGGKIWLCKTWHWNLWNNPVYLSRIIHTWKIFSISFLAEYPATFRFFMSLSFHILYIYMYICIQIYIQPYSIELDNWWHTFWNPNFWFEKTPRQRLWGMVHFWWKQRGQKLMILKLSSPFSNGVSIDQNWWYVLLGYGIKYLWYDQYWWYLCFHMLVNSSQN